MRDTEIKQHGAAHHSSSQHSVSRYSMSQLEVLDAPPLQQICSTTTLISLGLLSACETQECCEE